VFLEVPNPLVVVILLYFEHNSSLLVRNINGPIHTYDFFKVKITNYLKKSTYFIFVFLKIIFTDL